MMIVKYTGGWVAIVNSRVLQGDHTGTVAFFIDMWLWKAGTVHQVKRKDIFFSFFRWQIETSLQVGVSKTTTKK